MNKELFRKYYLRSIPMILLIYYIYYGVIIGNQKAAVGSITFGLLGTIILFLVLRKYNKI